MNYSVRLQGVARPRERAFGVPPHRKSGTRCTMLAPADHHRALDFRDHLAFQHGQRVDSD
jgi:hypothetical protein